MRVWRVEPGAPTGQFRDGLPAQEEEKDREAEDMEHDTALSNSDGGPEQQRNPADIDDPIPERGSFVSHRSINLDSGGVLETAHGPGSSVLVSPAPQPGAEL